MKLSLLLLAFLFISGSLFAQSLRGFKTDVSKRSIELDELIDGGPGKDGIPSIDNPQFISISEAAEWVRDREPVIYLEINGDARAYPIQILIWHEIVNDVVLDIPVLVTFCPLCYSAIVFDRRVDNVTYEFGVSGMLRHSDMIMYDRNTETLWQQFSGEAVVGELNGRELTILPSQLISFKQFRDSNPDGKVLTKETGYIRSYGQNPYTGYDDINNSPFLLKAKVSDKLPPMEKVIGVRTATDVKGYAYRKTAKVNVLHDTIGNDAIVIFHLKGMASALDNRIIFQSRDDGATGVFSPILEGEFLKFEYKSGKIRDNKTKSEWDVTGKAISGKFKGKQLRPIVFGDYFAFAWLVFYPDAEIEM